MFPFVLTPADIQALSFGFLFFILAIAAFFILATSYRDKIARGFALLALCGAVINLFGFLFHTTENLDIARWWRIISHSFNIAFVLLLLNFSLTLYEKYLPPKALYRALGWLFPAIMLLFSPFIILDVFGAGFLFGPQLESPSIQITPTPGPLLIWYIASLAAAAVFAFFLMLMLWRMGPTKEARVTGLLIVAAANIPIFIRMLNYAPWYGIGTVGYASLIAAVLTGPAFAIGTTYAILRHKLFNLRLVAAELFIFGLWSALFLKLLLDETLSTVIPDAVLLAATIVLGVFLIRSVIKEVSQREELERLTGELRTLNETLESKVVARTSELNASKSHVEVLIENLTVGLIEYRPDSTVVRINKAAEQLLGVRRLAVIGKTLAALKEEDSARSLAAVLEERGAQPPTGEWGMEIPDNVLEMCITYPEKRDIQLTTATLTSLDEKGGRGHLKLIRDITREKAIDRTKSEFISVAAHQLRTPLAALRWTLELFLGGSGGRVSKIQKEILGQAKNASENMVRIVNDLLNVVRIEEGRFGYQLVPGNVRELIDELLPVYKPIAKAKDIEFQVRRPAEDVPTVSLDAVKFSLAIQNLIDNAIKYTHAGGSVTISYGAKEGSVFVRVADTGVGITEEDKKKLFTKFFRSRRALQMFTDGSGLGLYIVKNIVDHHGGNVVIESEEGKGTTFTITLPIKKQS